MPEKTISDFDIPLEIGFYIPVAENIYMDISYVIKISPSEHDYTSSDGSIYFSSDFTSHYAYISINYDFSINSRFSYRKFKRLF